MSLGPRYRWPKWLEIFYGILVWIILISLAFQGALWVVK
jgi:hypothetical protein